MFQFWICFLDCWCGTCVESESWPGKSRMRNSIYLRDTQASGILIGTFHPGLINSILFIFNESARSQILMKPKEMIVGIAWHRARRFWLIWDRCKRRLPQSHRVCFGDQEHSEVVPALETVLARTWVSYVQLIMLDRNTGTCKSWFSYVDYKSHVSTQRQ